MSGSDKSYTEKWNHVREIAKDGTTRAKCCFLSATQGMYSFKEMAGLVWVYMGASILGRGKSKLKGP